MSFLRNNSILKTNQSDLIFVFFFQANTLHCLFDCCISAEINSNLKKYTIRQGKITFDLKQIATETNLWDRLYTSPITTY